jgi:hypothetical protein
LTPHGSDGIAHKYYVQDHIIITRIGMMLVRVPVAGTHMQLDISDAPFANFMKIQHRIVYIRSCGATGATRVDKLAGLAIVQR